MKFLHVKVAQKLYNSKIYVNINNEIISEK